MATPAIPTDALPMAVAEGHAKPATPEQAALVKLFNALRPDQRIDLRQQFQPHGYIPGAAIRRLLGLASVQDTTESGLA